MEGTECYCVGAFESATGRQISTRAYLQPGKLATPRGEVAQYSGEGETLGSRLSDLESTSGEKRRKNVSTVCCFGGKNAGGKRQQNGYSGEWLSGQGLKGYSCACSLGRQAGTEMQDHLGGKGGSKI